MATNGMLHVIATTQWELRCGNTCECVPVLLVTSSRLLFVVCWLVGLLDGRLVGCWLVCWLVGWLVGWSVLVGRGKFVKSPPGRSQRIFLATASGRKHDWSIHNNGNNFVKILLWDRQRWLYDSIYNNGNKLFMENWSSVMIRVYNA